MGTTPGAVADNLGLVDRRVLLQVFSIVREAGDLSGFDIVQSERQGHIAVSPVMPVSLAIRGDVNQLRPGARIGKCSDEPVCETLTIRQKILKGNGTRDRTVIKKNIHGLSGGDSNGIGHRRINSASVNLTPRPSAEGSHATCLIWRKNREFDTKLSQNFQGLKVHCRFWKPHSFRMPTEAAFKISNSPPDLRVLVPSRGERKDHVIVSLSHGRAMSRKMLLALTICRQDGLVDCGPLLL